MVPPTLSQMGKDVLPRKLNYLVLQLPKMENVEISDNQGGEEPINAVNQVVVIEIFDDVGPG